MTADRSNTVKGEFFSKSYSDDQVLKSHINKILPQRSKDSNTYTYMYIHTYMHKYIHTYIHTCIGAYTHTYKHTCIRTHIYSVS